MVKIGAHESIAGGMEKAVERALEDGCESLQVFNKSSSQWKAKTLSGEEIELFRRGLADSKLPVISHASYLINLAGPEKKLHRKSVAAFADELERCDRLGIPYLVIHPGSHKGTGEDPGLERVAAALDSIYDARPALATNVLLENTAGMGNCVGNTFEQLATIRTAMKHSRRVGVCFDTCHAFAAGYDMRTQTGYESTWARFDATVGLSNLKAFHLNDSKKDLACRVDRHEWIGDGFIGKDLFRFLVNDPKFADVPAVLETPPLESGEMSFKLNLRRLRKMRESILLDDPMKKRDRRFPKPTLQ